MHENKKQKMHWSFWAICIAGLLWNVGGAANYLLQTSPDFVQSMPATHQAIILGRPAWATAGFAFGVFGGALGCLLLMWRLHSSFYVLIVSVLGIIATVIHTLNVATSGTDFGLMELIVMVFLPLLVAVVLAAYAKRIQS